MALSSKWFYHVFFPSTFFDLWRCRIFTHICDWDGGICIMYIFLDGGEWIIAFEDERMAGMCPLILPYEMGMFFNNSQYLCFFYIKFFNNVFLMVWEL